MKNAGVYFLIKCGILMILSFDIHKTAIKQDKNLWHGKTECPWRNPMEYSFSPEEILEMAMQIEVNGAAFYRKAAEKVSSQEVHAFLISLAEMEDTHQKTFAAMQDALRKTDSNTLMIDPQGEARLYLKAMADTKIFFQKKNPGDRLKEILTSAIGAEQDSILFYLGMKEMVYDTADKQRIDDIIREEMGHITLLSQKLTETSQ